MSIIKKSVELEFPKTMKLMIYGQPGMGKSTLALSMPTPLLFDFDGGAKRINPEHLANIDVVDFTILQDAKDPARPWRELKNLLNNEVASLAPYQTIVIDTVGKMMDYLIAFKCGTKQPSIRDWSGINQEFSEFTRTLDMMHKHIVFVAHRDSRKDGDSTVFVPSLREKSYTSIVTDLDLLGYMVEKNIQGVISRTITFDPTNINDGKNTCNLPGEMVIPTIVDRQGKTIAGAFNNFLTTEVLHRFNLRLNAREEATKEYKELLDKITADVAAISDAKTATDFVIGIDKNYHHVGNSRVFAGNMLAAKAKELKLVWDKKAKSYVDASEPEKK